MKISVCMATYNGQRFVHEQLASILSQLGEGDEIVVVDDASSDQTVAIVERFCDGRIRVVRQLPNRGVLKSFARALEEARHDIIFLADQDDVWRADKVSKIKGRFLENPDLTLVLSDFSIIDSGGKAITGGRIESGEFRRGALRNFVRNSYRGCTMAFRRSLLQYCLPFPEDIPMHDMWIGIINDLVGKTGYIKEPLMSYRRHNSNESPDRPRPFFQIVRWRWALLKNLTLRYPLIRSGWKA